MNSFLAPARRTFHALLAGALLASLPAAIYAQDGEALSAASPSPGMRTDSVGLSPTPRDTIARAETSSFPDTVVRTGGAPPPDTARRAAAPMPDHSPDADSAVTEAKTGRPSRLRHRPSIGVSTLFETTTWVWSCGSPARES